MENQHVYPEGEVVSLLQSDQVSAFTEKILKERIENKPDRLFFLNEHEFGTLTIICDHLLAQDPAGRVCNPAWDIDKRLSEGQANGWRYNNMPTDTISYKIGLKYTDDVSIKIYQKIFIELDPEAQALVLQNIQHAKNDETVNHFLPHLFFEEMLAEVVEIYYSHPLVQETIGFAGMADAGGWKHIGLNGHDTGDIDKIYNKIS